MRRRSGAGRVRGLGFALAGLSAALAVATPVLADCYDVIGCSDHDLFSRRLGYLASPDGPDCDFLWMARNRIYAERGYCFKTDRGRQEIGNEGCRYWDMARVPLSSIERANVATIQRAERVKNCPR